MTQAGTEHRRLAAIMFTDMVAFRLPRSQFRNVLTERPRFKASVSLEIFDFLRNSRRIVGNECPVWEGGESTLTAMITSWQ